MTNVEIAMLLALIAYGIIFGIICAGLFNRTRRNKSGIEITNSILDVHNSRINGIIDRIDFLVQIIGDQLEELKASKEESEMEIKYKRCRFAATLDDDSIHKVLVKVPYDSPDDYIWILAIRQCENFKSPLKKLCWNETAIESEQRI